ncbi:hypothetical protein BpHYR1_054661 [Brachionus plicatilis]|uniref:Uncharacterized protein n=1 Tax=Brachionus plicatilis TaxID=10195 RepID=A0A3M7PZH1_BRAPC|nr:hypothetical protein BpHYR1_054661 [Brachionus plicatilis]
MVKLPEVKNGNTRIVTAEAHHPNQRENNLIIMERDDNSSKKLTEKAEAAYEKALKAEAWGKNSELRKGTGNFEYEHAIVKGKKFKWYWGVRGPLEGEYAAHEGDEQCSEDPLDSIEGSMAGSSLNYGNIFNI